MATVRVTLTIDVPVDLKADLLMNDENAAVVRDVLAAVSAHDEFTARFLGHLIEAGRTFDIKHRLITGKVAPLPKRLVRAPTLDVPKVPETDQEPEASDEVGSSRAA